MFEIILYKNAFLLKIYDFLIYYFIEIINTIDFFR